MVLLMSEQAFPWHEVAVADKAKAVAFYTTVLGWGHQEMDMGPMGTYDMFTFNGVPVAGVTALGEQEGKIPPHWDTYAYTDDVDAPCEKAKAAGGSVVQEPFDIPTVGRVAAIRDDQGATILLYKPAQS